MLFRKLERTCHHFNSAFLGAVHQTDDPLELTLVDEGTLEMYFIEWMKMTICLFFWVA